jgi:hypothetical protein
VTIITLIILLSDNKPIHSNTGPGKPVLEKPDLSAIRGDGGATADVISSGNKPNGYKRTENM